MQQHKNATLLIVEDNHDLRNGLKDILTFEGYSVLAAGNGREALEQMQAFRPDLIISDITMPEMDGYAFYDAVRARPDGVTLPFIFLTARGEREDVMRGRNLGAEDYLIKPVSRTELVAAVQSRLARFRQLQVAQMETAYQAALTALANGIEVRDRYTRGHVERVTAYSLAIAEQLGWTGPRLDTLRYGAILHDIGKIFISEEILTKSGRLSDEERLQMVQHPANGADMIKDIPYLEAAIPVIRYHHERWDGSGYPFGLEGDAIPVEARVIAVADSFDAMTTDRPYHGAVTLEEALQKIQDASGSLFDPMVVGAFSRAWQAGKVQAIASRWHHY
jgi:putative two-component system response regulator